MWRLGLTVDVSTLQLNTLEARAREILEFLPSLRNILQPVNRLPPEILSRIARYSLDEDVRDARSIVPLTHVCRYWRESITSAPENWTRISDDRIELAKLSLKRAKAARLDVTIDIHRFGAESFGLITDHAKNIDTLRVHNLSGREELTAAVPNFPQSTPNLQSLTLLCAYTSAEWDRSIDPFELLPPTLTCLSLFNVPLYPSLRNLTLLTDLTLRYHRFDLNLDTLLDFLEHNRWLESATLDIRFTEPALRSSRRREPIRNRLRHLSISCNNPMNAQVLISKIALRKGVHLEISSLDRDTGLNDILSGIPTTHLSNLPSAVFMEYRSYPRAIHLWGPNGSFSFSCFPSSATPFVEFPLLSLSNVREFQCPRVSPQTPRTRTALVPSRVPGVPSTILPNPRDTVHRLQRRFTRPSLHFAVESFSFTLSEHPHVFGLYYHPIFYGGPDALQF